MSRHNLPLMVNSLKHKLLYFVFVFIFLLFYTTIVNLKWSRKVTDTEKGGKGVFDLTLSTKRAAGLLVTPGCLPALESNL